MENNKNNNKNDLSDLRYYLRNKYSTATIDMKEEAVKNYPGNKAGLLYSGLYNNDELMVLYLFQNLTAEEIANYEKSVLSIILKKGRKDLLAIFCRKLGKDLLKDYDIKDYTSDEELIAIYHWHLTYNKINTEDGRVGWWQDHLSDTLHYQEVYYENGEFHGERRVYTPGGDLMIKQNYAYGKLHGKSTYYGPAGGIVMEHYYNIGEITKCLTFHNLYNNLL